MNRVGAARTSAVVFQLVASLMWHPRRWPTAVLAARRFAGPGWWRHSPFFPRPDRCWWAMRSELAYGDPQVVPDREDIVAFVTWLGQMRRWSRR